MPDAGLGTGHDPSHPGPSHNFFLPFPPFERRSRLCRGGHEPVEQFFGTHRNPNICFRRRGQYGSLVWALQIFNLVCERANKFRYLVLFLI